MFNYYFSLLFFFCYFIQIFTPKTYLIFLTNLYKYILFPSFQPISHFTGESSKSRRSYFSKNLQTTKWSFFLNLKDRIVARGYTKKKQTNKILANNPIDTVSLAAFWRLRKESSISDFPRRRYFYLKKLSAKSLSESIHEFILRILSIEGEM